MILDPGMIREPYRISSDIQKFTGDPFNKNPDKTILRKKVDEIQAGINPGGTLHGYENSIEKLCQFCNLDPKVSISDAALLLEEDVAIMNKGKLVSIFFCFPSGFDPVSKIGMSFSEIHEPIADSETLVKMGDKISAVISKTGSIYRRFVWTLTTSGNLSRHPRYKDCEPGVESIDKLFYRQETQTTVGLDGETSLFFVKVDVIPFLNLSEEMRNKIFLSIDSMSNKVLEYKGLNEIKKLCK